MWANSLIKNIVKRSILKVYKVYFFISKLKKRFDGSSLFLVYFSTIFFFTVFFVFCHFPNRMKKEGAVSLSVVHSVYEARIVRITGKEEVIFHSRQRTKRNAKNIKLLKRKQDKLMVSPLSWSINKDAF